MLAFFSRRTQLKKRNIIIAAVVAGILALLLLNPFTLGLIYARSHIHKMEAQVQNPDVYLSVGEVLAMYCQSYPLLHKWFDRGEEGYGVFLWQTGLPTEAYSKAVVPSWIIINQDGANVEFGAGFHHFGYELELDWLASTAFTNVWKLYWYSEDRYEKRMSNRPLLATFTLDKERHYTPEEVAALVLASCDALIHFESQHAVFRDQITRARAACARMLEKIRDADANVELLIEKPTSKNE